MSETNEYESSRHGSRPATAPQTPQVVADRKINANIVAKMRRDNVSFLMARVLPTSPGSPEDLASLRMSTPRTLESAQSATRETHSLKSLEGANRPDPTYMHKWNKDAEFADTMM
eukprot:CAMPEP_0197663756 /NCGR_PEP_ID=MMETSP1338-20131121/58219_1 /TAXON_ID=43686 ORGANISM="Pelagodinium beii, Strain RCC1491" /NCGR_SAMPLE_ID=MMETSP1338 /ASSEMBLY_ACC=CAM_ASM_000754 /LENGTH=114 /DNA_ID=CAMNT_0043242247 /DNA_START=39 /DNA_END=380 /DNA_ORIENTATION=+